MNRASITTLAKISCGEAAFRRVKMLVLVGAAAVVARSFVALGLRHFRARASTLKETRFTTLA